MFLPILLPLTLAIRIREPHVQVYNEKIDAGNYTRNAMESMDLDYYAYPGVFAIELHRRVNGNFTGEVLNLHDFEKVEEFNDQENGCYSFQRYIEIPFQLKLQLEELNDDPFVYFTDVATAEDSNRVYILRNDFRIYEAELSEGLTKIELNKAPKDFAELLNVNSTFDEEIFHPLFIDDDGQKRIYVVTELGGISFPTSVPLEMAELRVEPFKAHQYVHSVHYNARVQVITVAVGQDGVDFYDIDKDGNVHFRHNLNSSQLSLDEDINVIDIDTNDEETVMYVLDKEHGLIFYDIEDLGSIRQRFKIEISNARHFDHYGNTFYIVARTNNNQDYAVEIFVDILTGNYYFNTYHIDELTINNVAVFQHYAILIGEDGHKIVYHSIYNEFIDESLQSNVFFQEPDLVKVKEYDFLQKNYSEYRLLVGIAKQELKYLEIKMGIPSISCKLSEASTEEFVVFLNSTQCEAKRKANDKSPYSMCNITHSFLYTATQAPGNYKYYTKLTLTIYVLFVVLVWVIVIGYALCKKWGGKIKYLSWLVRKKAPAAPYQENFDVKEQEMSEQNQQQQ